MFRKDFLNGKVTSFLCTDAAEMIVGQTLYVDGGFSLLTDYFPELERSLQMEEVMT